MPYTANHPNRAALLNLVQQHRQNRYNSAFRGKASTRILSDTTVEDDEIDSWYADAQAANVQPPPNNVDELWVDLRAAIVPPVQTVPAGSSSLSNGPEGSICLRHVTYVGPVSYVFIDLVQRMQTLETILRSTLSPNPWSTVTPPDEASEAPVKSSAVEYYGFKNRYDQGHSGHKNYRKTRCLITGEYHYSMAVGGRAIVKAAHLLPRGAKDNMRLFGLGKKHINSPRNILLLCKTVEEAYDRLMVCFVRDPIHNTYRLKVC
ncbi:hypothetical protein PROFUN_15422 [Planoprotostelium fungivorum]|uniref:HNH nuclease domain-containing protein n=1 Tax=Planoprotostelium fungivorum TaxID=1890364 RepID=A0A2P6MWN3_9EUKA|nr:hypothetical protein PROFUN_15422 [Planoprotostelium fungivorum]